MKIYTRTGDGGETGLFDNRRVAKSDLRVEAIGEVDELNSAIGLAIVEPIDPDVAGILRAVQRDLFALGGRLADPSRAIATRVEKAVISGEDVARIEAAIDRFEAELPPLRRFILPGGTRAGALVHAARAVCRRAERRIVLAGQGSLEPELLAYVNRLSDLLFVIARIVNHRAGVAETEW